MLGLRTSFGRVPSETADAFTAGMSVNGPMARNASDLAMLLSVQAGYDSRVPLSELGVSCPVWRDILTDKYRRADETDLRVPLDAYQIVWLEPFSG